MTILILRLVTRVAVLWTISCFVFVSETFALSTRPTKSTRATTTSVFSSAPTFDSTTSRNPTLSNMLEKADRFLTKLQNPRDQRKDHTYLSGNYAPVAKEQTRLPTKIVHGSLPPTLNGMFCRNGPNPIVAEKINDNDTNNNDDDVAFRKMYHWFDGHAMLHNLRIEDGGAWYTNQFVPSIRYQVEKEDFGGQDYFPTLGEYTGIFGLIKILFHPTMVSQRVPNLMTVLPPNTNVLMYQDKFYCLNEGNLPFECLLLPNGTLQPVGYETFGGLLDYPVSAHPCIDGRNGDLLFHSYTTNLDLIDEHGTMKVGRYQGAIKDGTPSDKLASYFVPNTGKDYVSFAHGMVHSRNHMVLWDCSVHFDPKGMFDGGSFFKTQEDQNLKFGIVPKTATKRDQVVWIDTGEKGAVVHPLNAWEEDDATLVLWTPFCENLVIDLESSDINRFDMVEYRFDIQNGRLLSKKVIDDTVNVEFSVVPNMGEFNRYGYTAIQDPSTPGEGSFAGICFWDMAQRTLQTIYYDEHEVGGEPMVAQDEADGTIYVGTYTYNTKDGKSYFVLYHGETAELVCRMIMPSRVPYGFHGQWLSENKLRGHFQRHGMEETPEPAASN